MYPHAHGPDPRGTQLACLGAAERRCRACSRERIGFERFRDGSWRDGGQGAVALTALLLQAFYTIRSERQLMRSILTVIRRGLANSQQPMQQCRRVYFSAGNSQGCGAPYDPAIYRHIRYYEPGVGFGELKDWTLQGSAVETGQYTPDRKTCWLADDHSHVYRFEDEGPTLTYVGQIITESESKRSWMFQVSPDGRFA